MGRSEIPPIPPPGADLTGFISAAQCVRSPRLTTGDRFGSILSRVKQPCSKPILI